MTFALLGGQNLSASRDSMAVGADGMCSASMQSGTISSGSTIVYAPVPNGDTTLIGTYKNTITISAVSPSTAGIVAGMFTASGTSGIPTGDTISAVPSSTTLTLSSAATSATNRIGVKIILSRLKGTTTSGNATISSCSVMTSPGLDLRGNTLAVASILPGMGFITTIDNTTTVSCAGTVVSASGTNIVMSANVVGSITGHPLLFINNGACTLSGSPLLVGVALSTLPAAGMSISGTGIPAGTTIAGVLGTLAQFKAGLGKLVMSANATSTVNTALTIGA